MKPIWTKYALIYFIVVAFFTSMSMATAQESTRPTSNVIPENRVPSFASPPKSAVPLSHDTKTDELSTADSASGSLYYNVHVLGEIKRPDTFQVPPSSRVSDVLRRAGGMLPNGSQRHLELRREGTVKKLDFFLYQREGDLSHNPYVMENDIIFVPLTQGAIQIEGPIARPGAYEVATALSLYQAIEMAGGFTVGRSTKEPIRIIRFDKTNEKRMIEIVNAADTFKQTMLEKGDIIIVPHILLKDHKFDYDITSLPGDNIFYPTINDNVYVTGSVYQPGPYAFRPNFDYYDYIGLAGPINKASIRRSKILRTDGKKIAIKKETIINPGDTIYVPGKIVTASNLLSVFSTVTNMALTTFIFVDRFATD